MKLVRELGKIKGKNYPVTKIRHQMFFKGKKEDKLLMEQFVEWEVPQEDVENKAITQYGIMQWEEENFVNANIIVKRQVLDDKEWVDLQKKEIGEA
jgi:hypothetical protein